MSEGMLGNLPLSEIRGPVDTLQTLLASEQGRRHLTALKKMLRGENPFPIVSRVQEIDRFHLMLQAKNLLKPAEVFRFVSWEAQQIIDSSGFQEDTFVDEVQLVLLHFDTVPEYAHVLAEIKRLGLDRPSFKDALALGPYFCEVQEREVVFLHKPIRVRPDIGSGGMDIGPEPDGQHSMVLALRELDLGAIDIQFGRRVYAARRKMPR